MKRSNWLLSLVFAAVIPAMAEGPPMVEPGFHQTPFLTDEDVPLQVGVVSMWNTPQEFVLNVQTTDGWLIEKLNLFIHHDLDQLPMTKKGALEIKSLPNEQKFESPVDFWDFTFDLQDDLEFNWGKPWIVEHVKYVALYAEVIKVAEDGTLLMKDTWAYGQQALPGSNTAMAVPYPLYHPSKGHFIDSPVGGLGIISDTTNCKTDESGGFDYFPGERVELFLGHLPLGDALAAHKISPLDIFESADTSDPRVINMARLLQSLDADASPKEGIMITEAVEFCLFEATEALGLSTVDFSNADQIDDVIQGTISKCVGTVDLASVTAEDAKINLDRSLDSTMFRKDVSKSPDLGSTKAKLNIMPVWFPALKANGEATVIEYHDEDGNLIRTSETAKPLIITYTNEDPTTGAPDTYAAVSRDDGATWKRANLSRAGDRSSFVLANGNDYYGATKKPVMQVKGNNILVSWSSKFCKGGKPAYAIDPEDEYTYDDLYWTDDIFGVGGPQRSHDYTEDGFPEVGELPYSCVWSVRGTIVTQGMINSGGFWADKLVGDVVWFKPERMTSGRRDALQIFMGGAEGAGMAIAWQEDPAGLRPGKMVGPGHGWSGATTNHKTDIWYSYMTLGDFRKIDMNFVVGGDPEHELDVVGRPKALVPMSLPVRLSDNDVVNTDNLLVELGDDGYPVGSGPDTWTPVSNADALAEDGDGTHRYGYEIEGLCDDFYDFINYAGDPKSVCITADGRLLDGDTGASRVNLFLQTYTKPDLTKSAWAIINYEETKGAGAGAPDHDGEGDYGDDYLAEQGKNVIYHSFDFQNPELVSAGDIVNLPERDVDGNLLYLQEEEGALILDYLDQPQLAYENSRRARFILQGKAAMGDSRTIMNIVYKEGQEGSGRPSDILLRRVVVPVDQKGNPYRFTNIVCNEKVVADNGLTVCVDGTQNMSTVTPTVTTDSEGDSEQDDPYGAIKVTEWIQTTENFDDQTWLNPYEDARAHRGQLRGNLVTMGFSYTPNWAAARNGNDKYDFFIRRSFDGGQTWTTDPAGTGVEHCQLFKTLDTNGGLTRDADGNVVKEEVCTFYPAGAFEQARNLSQLPNAKSSVIEPRIVCPPGTIKVAGVWTGIAEDKQNKDVCYVAYGTSTNPKKDPVTGEQEHSVPLDLFYSFTQDRGETHVEVAWDVNPDSDGNLSGETVFRWDYLAKGEPEQGEVQLRSTPDGSRFYSSWLGEGPDGSNIMFRRIMSPAFPVNVADVPAPE